MSKVLALLAVGLGRAAADKFGTVSGCSRDCTNSDSWLRNGDPNKDCGWVKKDRSQRCRYRETGPGADPDATVVGYGVLAADACPKACKTCPADCKDSFTWYQNLPETEQFNALPDILDCTQVIDTGSDGDCNEQEFTDAFTGDLPDPNLSPKARSACIKTCSQCPGSNRQFKGKTDDSVAYDGCVYIGDSAPGGIGADATIHNVGVIGDHCCDDTYWVYDLAKNRGCKYIAKDPEDRCGLEGERDGVLAWQACPAACGRCALCTSVSQDILKEVALAYEADPTNEAPPYDNCCDDPTWTHDNGVVTETCAYIAAGGGGSPSGSALRERCNTWMGTIFNQDGTENTQTIQAKNGCRATCGKCAEKTACCAGNYKEGDPRAEPPRICDSEKWVHKGREWQACDWVAELPCKRCELEGTIDGARTMTAMEACPVACGQCLATDEPTAEPTVTAAPVSSAPTLTPVELSGRRALSDELMDEIERADEGASALQFFFVDFGAPGTGSAPSDNRRRLFDSAKGCRDAPFASGQCAMKLHDVPAVCGAWKDCAGVVCGPADFVLDGETACVARGAVDFGTSDSNLYALVKEAPKLE